eukprot:CAMPEP_0197913216 /NCGR_PEP_ID=MMETSP1439-20131203/76241_1 /TAXON_ID=66791 /ORGANISM="Gonyaulax spinifera, Strain CCMP409" /LENGTH=205 /DNA_ID=CAMNT_0043535057 /DNA_START=43 /DNA_END=660 /DNA_ORIENTATION=-
MAWRLPSSRGTQVPRCRRTNARSPWPVRALLPVAALAACCLQLPPRQAMLGAAAPPAASKAPPRPNFSGTWQLEKAENQSNFMRAIGYNFLVAQAAFLARVTQTIRHEGDELHFTFEVVPPLLAPTRTSTVRVGVPEILMTDDAGREMLLLNPSWKEATFSAGLRYLSPKHELVIDRYMEDGHMVEHVRYPAKDIEMRRVFKRVQ